jgi:hypothetical protein
MITQLEKLVRLEISENINYLFLFRSQWPKKIPAKTIAPKLTAPVNNQINPPPAVGRMNFLRCLSVFESLRPEVLDLTTFLWAAIYLRVSQITYFCQLPKT